MQKLSQLGIEHPRRVFDLAGMAPYFDSFWSLEAWHFLDPQPKLQTMQKKVGRLAKSGLYDKMLFVRCPSAMLLDTDQA